MAAATEQAPRAWQQGRRTGQQPPRLLIYVRGHHLHTNRRRSARGATRQCGVWAGHHLNRQRLFVGWPPRPSGDAPPAATTEQSRAGKKAGGPSNSKVAGYKKTFALFLPRFTAKNMIVIKNENHSALVNFDSRSAARKGTAFFAYTESNRGAG